MQAPGPLTTRPWIWSWLTFGLLLAACSTPPSPTASPTPPISRGDQPSYVAITTCPVQARFAIQRKRLPPEFIHTCEETLLTLDTGEQVTLIKVRYGEAMDCPAGCIYQTYFGLITEEQALIDLPVRDIATGMWGRPPFNEWRTWWTEDHASRSHQEVAVRNGHYGWVLKLDYYRFTLLYWKSYGEQAELGKTLYTASGEIFVYLDAEGKEVWDYSRFQVSTQELQ